MDRVADGERHWEDAVAGCRGLLGVMKKSRRICLLFMCRVGEKKYKKKKRTLGCGGTCVNSKRFKAAQGCQRKAFIWNK